MTTGWGQAGCGDVNDDGYTNVQDVILIIDCSLAVDCYSEDADLIADGFVNVLDIVSLIDRILNLTNYLTGTYNVDFFSGFMINGECIIDTMMDMGGGPATAQVNLGPPDQSGTGQMQYFEEFIDEFSTIPAWEYQVDSVNTESDCQAYADSSGSDYWFCGNWGFENQSCEEYSSQDDCLNNDDCFWETNFCYPTLPANQWMECYWLDEWECESNPECMPGDDGPPDCIIDCAGSDTISEESTALELCTFITTYLFSGGLPNDCIEDCNEEVIFDGEGSYDGTIMDSIVQLNMVCEICMAADDPESMCEEMWDGGDGVDGSCYDCDCGDDSLDCWSECCADDGPGCFEDCLDIDTISPENNPTADEICEYLTGVWGEAGDSECVQDCEGDDFFVFNYLADMCEMCLEDPNIDCEDYIIIGDRFAFDLEVALPDALSAQINKMQVLMQRGNFLSRLNSCDDGYDVDDCSGDGDCCPIDWIGDGYADCQDQQYGCDLSCYDNDGGDCDGYDENFECVPSNPCYYIYNSDECAEAGCEWLFDSCQPQLDFGDDECFDYDEDQCFFVTGCFWELPDWVDPWQTGACMNFNPCYYIYNSDECAEAGCEWDLDNWECVEIGSTDEYCDCFVQLTEVSCEEIGGDFQLPPWAEDCEDCEWVEEECFIPMTEEDCFFDYNDPCSEYSFGGSNEETLWDESTHTCTKTFSFTQEGTWTADEICLELIWEDVEEPSCSELPTEDTCYCFDCQWDHESGQCTNRDNDGNGRDNSQYKMRQYVDSMYKSNSNYKLISGDRECMNYTQDCEGNIFISIENLEDPNNPENGFCQEIILTIINPY